MLRFGLFSKPELRIDFVNTGRPAVRHLTVHQVETAYWFVVIAVSLAVLVAYVLTAAGCHAVPLLPGRPSIRPLSA
jgi:hypothetical protein